LVKISSSKFEEEIKKIISELEDLREASEQIEQFYSRLCKVVEQAIDEATRSGKRLSFKIPVTSRLSVEIKTHPSVFTISSLVPPPEPSAPWKSLPGYEWTFRKFYELQVFVANFDNFLQNLAKFKAECKKENKEAKQLLERLEKLFAPLLITASMKS